jgi:hypothetical protein
LRKQCRYSAAMRLYISRRLLVVALFALLPVRAPAPLVYQKGTGWVHEPVAAGGNASVDSANQLSAQERAAGWRLLFDGKTSNGWRRFSQQSFPVKGWVVDDGWLHCLGKGGGDKGGGDIITDAQFGDFELEWDWKLVPGGNSGVKYFILESRKEALGHEYQMIDDAQAADALKLDGKHRTASFYAVLAPSKTSMAPMGEINHSRILVKGNHVEHWLNGKKVLEYECGSDQVKAEVAASKFKNVAGFGDKVRGHILLQDHNCKVWFQNVKIRES